MFPDIKSAWLVLSTSQFTVPNVLFLFLSLQVREFTWGDDEVSHHFSLFFILIRWSFINHFWYSYLPNMCDTLRGSSQTKLFLECIIKLQLNAVWQKLFFTAAKASDLYPDGHCLSPSLQQQARRPAAVTMWDILPKLISVYNIMKSCLYTSSISVPNHSGLLRIALQWYCLALCKISTWSINWEISYGQMRFCEIWVLRWVL